MQTATPSLRECGRTGPGGSEDTPAIHCVATKSSCPNGVPNTRMPNPEPRHTNASGSVTRGIRSSVFAEFRPDSARIPHLGLAFVDANAVHGPTIRVARSHTSPAIDQVWGHNVQIVVKRQLSTTAMRGPRTPCWKVQLLPSLRRSTAELSCGPPTVAMCPRRRRIALAMELGASALDNCSPNLKSNCTSCNVQHGPQVLGCMPKGPPAALRRELLKFVTNSVMPLGNSCPGRVWVGRFLGSRNMLSVRSVPRDTSAPSDHWRVRPTAPTSMLEQPSSTAPMLQASLAEINTSQRPAENSSKRLVNLVLKMFLPTTFGTTQMRLRGFLHRNPHGATKRAT